MKDVGKYYELLNAEMKLKNDGFVIVDIKTMLKAHLDRL